MSRIKLAWILPWREKVREYEHKDRLAFKKALERLPVFFFKPLFCNSVPEKDTPCIRLINRGKHIHLLFFS